MAPLMKPVRQWLQTASNSRGPTAEPVERNARHQIDDRPQSPLRQRGAGARKDDRQHGLGDELRPVSEKRRGRSDDSSEREDRVRTERTREPVDADQADQRQHGRAEKPERQRAPDGGLHRKRPGSVRGDEAAYLGHVPVGVQDQEDIEEERQREEADRLHGTRRPIAAGQGHRRAAEIHDKRNRRARNIKPEDVGPGPGQLPKPERVVSLIGEEREGRGVERDDRLSEGALGPGHAHETEPGGARNRGEGGVSRHDRPVGRERNQCDAGGGRQRRRDGPLDRSRYFHLARVPVPQWR